MIKSWAGGLGTHCEVEASTTGLNEPRRCPQRAQPRARKGRVKVQGGKRSFARSQGRATKRSQFAGTFTAAVCCCCYRAGDRDRPCRHRALAVNTSSWCSGRLAKQSCSSNGTAALGQSPVALEISAYSCGSADGLLALLLLWSSAALAIEVFWALSGSVARPL